MSHIVSHNICTTYQKHEYIYIYIIQGKLVILCAYIICGERHIVHSTFFRRSVQLLCFPVPTFVKSVTHMLCVLDNTCVLVTVQIHRIVSHVLHVMFLFYAMLGCAICLMFCPCHIMLYLYYMNLYDNCILSLYIK